MSRSFVSYPVKRAIDAKLAEVLKSNGDGTFTYLDDWTDEKVAEAIGQGTKRTHVLGVRRAAYGNLRAAAPVTVGTEVGAIIAALEKRVANLERFVEAFIDSSGGVDALADRQRQALTGKLPL